MDALEACFTGKVITEPESKISAAGNAWMRFNVAIGEGEEVQYIQVKAFGDTAAKLRGQIAKGSKVYAEGKLRLDRWQKMAPKNPACPSRHGGSRY
jgi:single-stranded DNA-binding protein